MARLINAGEDFATEGERRVAEELKRLPDQWLVIANKVLATHHGRSYEIDFIVVGDRLIFALDEKGWRGKIHGTDAIWVRPDGSSERSPLGKVDYVAKVLAGWLRERVSILYNLDTHVVAGAVVLSRAATRPILHDPRAARSVFLLDELVDGLVARDQADGAPEVGLHRAKIVAALHDLSHRPKIPKQIGPYQVLEELQPFAGARRFRAMLASDPSGSERLLTVYPTEGNVADAEAFHLQEFRALRELRPTGVVPEALDPFPWSDDFLVVPSYLPRGTSLGAMPGPADESGAVRELERAAASFDALAEIHRAGVIHRSIGPDSIYFTDDAGAASSPRPTFSNFYAAKRGTETIASHLDALGIEDPYAAPEVAAVGYGFATEQSDVYSLALVWLERLSGVPVARLVREDRFVRIPESDQGWAYLPQQAVDDLRGFFQQALAPGPLLAPGAPGSERPTAATCAARLCEIATTARPQRIGEGSLLDNRYEVVRVLGVGATAHTFLVRDTLYDGLFAAKRFRRPLGLEARGALRAEFSVLMSEPHPNLAQVHAVNGPTDDIHVLLRYVEGPSLKDRLAEYQGDLARCRELADNLLAAVEHLERHELLHRDIKPDNVILHSHGGGTRAVLVDFGAAAPVGTRTGTVGTPHYLPPEAYFAEVPPSSSDRYALAVLLLRAFTGRLPFAGSGEDLDQRPLTQGDLSDLTDDARDFVDVLLGAIALDPTKRPASAAELREALLPPPVTHEPPVLPAPTPELKEEINPNVDLIRSLFRNSARGNADNRGLDTAFARDTYVPTALDERLLPAIFADRPRVVFLGGNPGDGKTAFLERFQQALRERGGVAVEVDPSGWVWTLDGRTYRACYDASEAHGGLGADEQLIARLAGLEGDAPPREDLTVLIAINDGRLADVIDRHSATFGWLARETERAYRPGEPLRAGGVWLIDLKRRAFVFLRPEEASPSVMRRILATLTAAERWEVCGGCAARAECPIRHNAAALGDIAGTPVTRLEHALLLAHLRQGRHLTIRDLRSGLAYLLTGDVGCEAIHEARRDGKPLPEVAFWQTVFATETSRDIMLGELRAMDPARSPQPLLERFLFFHRDSADAALRSRVFEDGADVATDEDPTAWMARVKRRLYFFCRKAGDPETEAPLVPWPTLLPYRYAATFMEALSEDGLAGLPDLPQKLAKGIGHSDGLVGPILDRGLCLRVAHSDVNRLTILKIFPLEEFQLTVRRPPAGEVVEALPEALVLRHQRTNAELTITLDVFEVLMRFAEGMEPSGPELQPIIEDLAPFKSRVQLSNTRELILVESGRQAHMVSQVGRTVVRTDFAVRNEVP